MCDYAVFIQILVFGILFAAIAVGILVLAVKGMPE